MRNLLVMVLLVSLASISQGSVVITTTASVGPSPTSVSFGGGGGYSGQVLSRLSTGTSPVIYPPPLPFAYCIAPDVIHWGDITVDNSDQASVWLGEVITDPLSPFYGEKGTAFYVNVVIVGDGLNKFSADDISWQVSSTDAAHSLIGSDTLAGMTYGVDPIVGLDYGPDGIRSYDDIAYNRLNPAPGSIKVDMILFVGVAVAYDATNVGLDSVKNYVTSVAPFNITTSYTVNDGTGNYTSSQTRTVVPEPLTLITLGLGALVAIKRRRKQSSSI